MLQFTACSASNEVALGASDGQTSIASCTVVNDLRGRLTIPVQGPVNGDSLISSGTPEEALKPGDRPRFCPAKAFPTIDRLRVAFDCMKLLFVTTRRYV